MVCLEGTMITLLRSKVIVLFSMLIVGLLLLLLLLNFNVTCDVNA